MHLENLGRLRALAFDKTGTVTRGKLQVTDLVPFGKGDERSLLRLAVALESRSTHPLAQAVLRRAQQEQLDDVPQVEQLQTLAAKGLRAQVHGQEVRLGNRTLYATEGMLTLPAEINEQIERLEEQGKTTMIVQAGEQFLGLIALADQIRETAPSVMASLKRLGIDALVMLTGDNQRVATTVAEQLGMTDVRVQLLPEQKGAALKDVLAAYALVGMVGDGVNDAPALAQATVGLRWEPVERMLPWKPPM